MIPVADPFMAGHEPPTRRPGDFTRSKRGTPYVSDPTGRLVKPKRKSDPPRIATTPYSRPSGFGKIIEDMYSIHKWDQRQEAYGFAVAPELVERAAILIEIEDRESDQWKDEADKIIGAAKAAAKASLAADRGTHAHELTEDDDEGRDIITRIEHGEELGLTPDVQHSLVTAWQDMLKRDQLQILAVEMPVVNDTYRGAGTLDRVGRLLAPLRFRLVTGEIVELPAGWTGILDVKSGKRRLRPDGTVMYWHGYAIQVFLYANGVPYDTETDTRGEWEWEIDQRFALIAHLDVLGAIDGNPSCDLILVDLEAGRRAADLCVAAKAWSNESTVFSVAQLEVGETCRTCGGLRMVTVGDGDYEGAGCHEEPCPDCDSVAQIVVDPHYKCQHFLMGGVGHCWINHDQIVEGVDPCPAWSESDIAEGHTPSTLSPVHPPAAGEGADVSSGTTPSPAMSEALAWAENNLPKRVTYDGPWGPDPDRLALVDARSTLCATPNEGADLTDGSDELWDRLRTEFDQLPPAAKKWRSELAQRAKQRGVSFLAQEAKTERRYSINRGLITLAIVDPDDDILRELLAIALGEIAWYIGIEPGHLVGSLDYMQAAKFADLCDTYISPPPAA